MKKKYIILSVIIFIIFLSFLFLIPKNTVRIENAVVNTSNGDIAFSYIDKQYDWITKIFLYSKDGSLLFKDDITTHGRHLFIEFVNDSLMVYIGGHSDKIECYLYSRTGVVNKSFVLAESMKKPGNWKNWNLKYGKKSYVFSNCKYVYEYTPYPKSLFNSTCVLRIENTDNKTSTVIFEKQYN